MGLKARWDPTSEQSQTWTICVENTYTKWKKSGLISSLSPLGQTNRRQIWMLYIHLQPVHDSSLGLDLELTWYLLEKEVKRTKVGSDTFEQ